jgi:hypothetical protein
MSKATKSVICDYFNHFGQAAKWAFSSSEEKLMFCIEKKLFMVKCGAHYVFDWRCHPHDMDL